MKKAVFIGTELAVTQANGRKKKLSGEFEIVAKTSRAVVLRQGKVSFSVPVREFRHDFKEV